MNYFTNLFSVYLIAVYSNYGDGENYENELFCLSANYRKYLTKEFDYYDF